MSEGDFKAFFAEEAGSLSSMDPGVVDRAIAEAGRRRRRSRRLQGLVAVAACILLTNLATFAVVDVMHQDDRDVATSAPSRPVPVDNQRIAHRIVSYLPSGAVVDRVSPGVVGAWLGPTWRRNLPSARLPSTWQHGVHAVVVTFHERSGGTGQVSVYLYKATASSGQSLCHVHRPNIRCVNTQSGTLLTTRASGLRSRDPGLAVLETPDGWTIVATARFDEAHEIDLAPVVLDASWLR